MGERLARVQAKGCRKLAPSTREFNALEVGTSIPVRVRTTAGGAYSIIVDSSTTVKELQAAVAREAKLRNLAGFGLFDEAPELQFCHYLEPTSNVCDALAQREILVTERGLKKEPEFHFLLKKAWYMNPAEKTRDKQNINLRYHQAVQDVLAEKQPLSEEEAAFLAAVQLRVNGVSASSLDSAVSSGLATLQKVIPARLLPLHDLEEWVELIKEASQEITENEKHRLQRLYLKTVTKWPLFGSSLYYVQTRDRKKEALILAINKDGVHLLKHGSKTPFKSFSYSEINNYASSPDSFGIVTGNMMRPERLYFTTKQGQEIEEIYRGYINRNNELNAKIRRAPRKLDD